MIDWPWGRNVQVDEDGSVWPMKKGGKPEFWVCPRKDEPDTWYFWPNQHVGQCCECQTEIIYRHGVRSPRDDSIKKICSRCMEQKIRGPSAKQK